MTSGTLRLPCAAALVSGLLAVASCGADPSTADPGPADPSARSSASSTSASATPTAAATAIPDEFPLAQGMQADADNVVKGPARDVEGVGLHEVCDVGAAWPGDAQDRLVASQFGPEYALIRDLVLYPDESTAQAVLERLRDRASHCHHHHTEAGGADVSFGMLDLRGLGDDATAFAETMADGSPGGAVFAFVRVGRAVLGIEDGGEWLPSSVDLGLREVRRDNGDLVEAMSLFAGASR